MGVDQQLPPVPLADNHKWYLRLMRAMDFDWTDPSHHQTSVLVAMAMAPDIATAFQWANGVVDDAISKLVVQELPPDAARYWRQYRLKDGVWYMSVRISIDHYGWILGSPRILNADMREYALEQAIVKWQRAGV